MKRFVFLFLVGTFAASHLASAEDEAVANKQNARRNAIAAKLGAKPIQGGGQSVRVQPNAQRSPYLNQGAGRSVYQQNMRGTGNRPRIYNPNVNVTPGTGVSANVGVGNNVVRNRNWQNRTRFNNSGANSQLNNSNANQNGRNTDSSTSSNDWQNRNGDGNGNGNANRGGRHWGNNHNWDRQHRSRSYWRSHYTRFALFGGGYYYWNSGYWYPAYGYDPYYSTYSYDAPIYAYNDQDPGQVIAQVQTALQRRGYDVGGIDGTYGPATRNALVNYQQDNGLEPTGEIDEATLDSLGLQ